MAVKVRCLHQIKDTGEKKTKDLRERSGKVGSHQAIATHVLNLCAEALNSQT